MNYLTCIFVVVLLVKLSSFGKAYVLFENLHNLQSNYYSREECDEIYRVKEGETLHSISDKCNDPFILENNPHVQQHDDVSPGFVIKITRGTNIPRKLFSYYY
ncbi:hypothetical protein ACJIZ3_018415 [Penstemon smallii]|uniref:LysM domain-containing protein n=1 Tax=Penstemon smallii TaxID=265156 RepID=A0ABD3SYW5_9LAMI